MNDIDLYWLAEQASKHFRILELGAFAGKSTRALCDNTSGNVVTVDLWSQEGNLLVANFFSVFQEFVHNLLDHLISHKLFYYQSTTDFALTRLREEGKTFDFIFIDACHEYDQVKKDILDSWKILEPGGIISGHDYLGTWGGVKKAVDELFPDVQIINGIWYVEKDK
mgnify:CR=1 FL=1